MIGKIDHVALAVSDLDAAIDLYRGQWGFQFEGREIVEDQGVEEAMFRIGDSQIQLISPLSHDTVVGKFLEKRGEGLHHIAYRVENLESVLRDLQSKGIRLIDERPRPGGGGCRIAFVHPKANRGLLIELVERPPGTAVLPDA